MDGLYEVTHVTVSIQRPPQAVYAFITDGQNLPRWASGVGNEVRALDDTWVARGPLGEVRVRFAPPNVLGVADHDVTLPSGATVHNPLRVIPNGTGSSVVFTLLRLPGVTEQQLSADAETVQRDLETLKALLEAP